MAKTTFVPVVDTAVTGRAKVSESQARSMNSAPIDYTVGNAYFVPAQYAHEVPSSAAGFAPSKRVFAVEYQLVGTELVPTGNLTAIKLSSINQTYLGEVTDEEAPVIHCELNDAGAYRPIRGEATYHRATPGAKGLVCEGDNPKMRYGMIYWADRQIQGYVPKFDADDRINHTMIVDDDNVLSLDKQNIMLWRTESAVGRKINLKLRDILPANTPHLDELCVD